MNQNKNPSKRWISEEKERLRSKGHLKVDILIDKFIEMGKNQVNKAALVLKNIYKKNYEYAIEKKIKINTNLYSLLYNPLILIWSYSSIKANKGALTKAYVLSCERYNKLNIYQKRFITRSYSFPDGINYDMFKITSELLKKGEYPWGTSRRVYVDKPGTEKKRPLTSFYG